MEISMVQGVRRWLLPGVLLVLAITTHAWHLEYDIPAWFAPYDIGYQIDEGYKTLDPRNLALFGETNWHPEDDYPGWMRSSPLTQWPYYFAFMTLGAKAASARWVTIGYFLCLVLVTYLFLAHRGGYGWAAIIAGSLIFEPVLFHFSRVAIFEIPVTFWVYATLFLAVQVTHRYPFPALLIMFAGAALGSQLLKLSVALYLLPPIAALSLGWLTASVRSVAARVTLVSAALIAAAGSLAYTHDAWWMDRITLASPVEFLQRLLLNPLADLTPLSLFLGYSVLSHLLITRPQRIFSDPFRLSLASIIIGVPIIFALLFSYAPPRYYVAVVPACLLLTGDWFRAKDWRLTPDRSLKPICAFLAVSISSLALFFGLRAADYAILTRLPLELGDEPGVSGIAMFRYLAPATPLVSVALIAARFRLLAPARTLSIALLAVVFTIALGSLEAIRTLATPAHLADSLRAKLTASLPPDIVVAGDWAPFFALGTPLRALYVNDKFNSAKRFSELKPDYFLDGNTRSDVLTRQAVVADPQITLGRPSHAGTYLGHQLRLWPLSYPDPP
jgi:hypothetical protein